MSVVVTPHIETDRFKMECEICHRTPNVDGVTLYRTGDKGPGVNPHWRCLDDLESTKQLDPELVKIVGLIESHGKTKH